jgi:Leucine-rich repeat (LRR) protein
MGTRRSLQLNTLVLKTLLLLFYGASGTNSFVVHGNTTDRRSLLDFKEAITDDPTGALDDWNDNINHCMWSGVSCSTRHPGRVTNLTLGDLNLTGQITPSIGNLTFLRRLDLSLNHFSGQLPPLNRLIKLKHLFLVETLLHENIQDALIAHTNCSELEWLDLYGNMLVGSIPRNIGSLSSLTFMSLSSNSLTGNIPPTFSNITHLERIFLHDNQLEGSIPEELFQLPDIQAVTLSSNRLSGRVPAAFFNQSSLEALDLSMNALSGTLPSDIGDTLPNLMWLSLGTNNLEGHIPASLGNASMLYHLDLSSNYFTGQIR